jgi:hypothetical protein
MKPNKTEKVIPNPCTTVPGNTDRNGPARTDTGAQVATSSAPAEQSPRGGGDLDAHAGGGASVSMVCPVEISSQRAEGTDGHGRTRTVTMATPPTPSEKKTAAGHWLHEEAAVAEATGIARGVLKTAREKIGAAIGLWAEVHGRVVYSFAGLRTVLETVAGDRLPDDLIDGVAARSTCVEGNAASAADAEDLQAQVVRFYLNPRLIQIRLLEGSKALGNLRVRDTKNFRTGMVVPVRWEESIKAYVLTRRAPRFPGRW